MGLRCLLGHDFDQPQVERERDVDGDEVVVTVREVKTCRRCGERQVVSESKEVTTLEEYHLGPDAVAGREESAADAATTNEDSADGAVDDAGEVDPTTADPTTVDAPGDHDRSGAVAGTDPAAADPTTADAPGDQGDTGGSTHVETADAVDDTVEAIGAVRDAGDVADEPDAGGSGGGDDDVADDDGIILDDDADERRRGEWPDAPDVDFDAGPAPDGAAPTADAPSTDTDVVADADPDADADGAAGPDADATADGVSADGDATAVGADAADGEDAVPEDDAEFIDAGPADDDPEPETDVVAWPAHDSDPAARAAGATDGGDTGGGESTGAAATSGWPDPEGDDEGFDAAPADGDRPAVSFGGGLTPDAVDDAGEYVGHERETATDAEFVSAPDADASDASDAPARRIEFYCPSCGHTESAGATSMRAGDICPDCRKGYIAERTT